MNNLAPIDEGKDLITKEWLEQNIARTAVISQTYTGVYNDNTSYPYWMFIRMIPNDNVGMWHIFYRMRAYTSNATASYRGEYYCEFWGYNRIVTGYKIWNSRRDYPFYYHGAFWSSSDANALKYGHFLGIYFNNANNDTNVNYKRTFEVEIIAYDGCSVELLPNAVRYNVATTMKVNGVDTSVTISSYGSAATYNATSNGLQETGDSDTTSQNYFGGTYSEVAEGGRISRYTLCGFTKDGKLQQIGTYTSGSTLYGTTAQDKASGIRTYATKGFDFNRGLFYYSGTTAFNAGASFTSSLFYNILGIDFRYSDNCVASSTANTLGMVNLKPVYLRGTIGEDGMFYLAPIDVTYNSKTYTRVWTQDIPTTDDGYVYWLVGYPYYNSSYVASLYQLTILFENPLFHFKDGQFRRYVSYKMLGDAPTSLPASDVPAWAKAPTKPIYTLDEIGDGSLRSLTNYLTKSLAADTYTPKTLEGLNAHLTTLPVWSATPGDGTYFIRQDTGGTNTFGKVPFSTLWTYIKGKGDNTYAPKSGLTDGSVTKVGTTTVGASNRPIYLNAGTPTAVSQINEDYIGSHNTHGFTNGKVYYDSYQADKNFQVILENYRYDSIRFALPNLAEYWDFTTETWKTWELPQDFKNLFDGRADTGCSIPYTHRKFRLYLTPSSRYMTQALVVFQSTWWSSGTFSRTPHVTVETCSGPNPEATFTIVADIDFAGRVGTNVIPCQLHSEVHNYLRFTIDYGDWSKENAYPLRRVMCLSNYGGRNLLPRIWSYEKALLPLENNKQDIGSSSTKWANIYATTFRGSLNGDAIVTYIHTTNNEIRESNGNRLSVGSYNQTTAKGFNVGDLLVSNLWADYTKVPTNGIYSKGSIVSGSSVTATSFIKSGGTSSQFLKADGSVDANTYLTTADRSDFSSVSTKSVPSGGKVVVTGLSMGICFSRRSNGGASKVWTYTGYGNTYIRNNLTVIDNSDSNIKIYFFDGYGFVIENTNPNNAADITILGRSKATFTDYDETTHGALNTTSNYKTLSYDGHTHGYLPLTGGTLTGNLTVNGNVVIPALKYLKIGDAILSWDGANQCLTVDKSFYSTRQISAGGAGNPTGEGGGSSDFVAIRCTQAEYDERKDSGTLVPYAYYFIEEEE